MNSRDPNVSRMCRKVWVESLSKQTQRHLGALLGRALCLLEPGDCMPARQSRPDIPKKRIASTYA